MESMEVSYKYQGKTDAFATFTIEEEEFNSAILQPLKSEGVVYRKCCIDVHDISGNLLCIATTNWQIKTWEKVKTKLS